MSLLILRLIPALDDFMRFQTPQELKMKTQQIFRTPKRLLEQAEPHNNNDNEYM